MRARSALRVVVSGMLAGTPGQGGATCAVLQYVLGLRELGHDVYFVEPVADAGDEDAPFGRARSAYFRSVVARFGLADRAAMIVSDTRETLGMPYAELVEASKSADLLLNLSGVLRQPDLVGATPSRVYVDLDPAFTQLWQAEQGIDMGFDDHTDFVTVGLGLGTRDCNVPLCGREWTTTLQPVVLSQWPVGAGIERNAFTSVANWRAYGSVTHDGRFYGQKVHATRELIDLPRRTQQRIELALGIHPDERADLALLREHGWELLDPAVVAGDPDSYSRFVRGSKAEIGIAKTGYTLSQCGWFSDRSACYLASGRPVVAQETGFSSYLPTGEGLLAFEDVGSGAAAMDEVDGNYELHSRRAREIAEAYFDSRRVLARLLDLVTTETAATGRSH